MTSPLSHWTPQRYARLRAVFGQALEQPAAQRLTWIEAQVADADDRAALLRLLAAEDSDGLLDVPPGERLQRLETESDFALESLIGRQFGAFTLVRLLGQGGMARVFLGERQGGDMRQRVAVKLLRCGLYSPLEQRLFRREQQALASLSHPNIAHFIDGGVSETGVPYLVLEYVDGIALTRYAADHQLSLAQRLRLFVTVCRAVAAAHRQLIVHRDIKPSNILVDGDGTVKLVDFGIAKLLQDEPGEATRTALPALTPDYAAPEQFSGATITTATDVYALGVVLHELLLGCRPDEKQRSQRPSLHVEAEPLISAGVLSSRTTLQSALRGDLDNVLLCALAAEPERRYASAAEFGDDIERHLAAQPVSAHPPSTWYRTRKFVRRHRGGVAITAMFVLAVFAALGIALWQAQVARHHARVAEDEARRANSVRDLLIGLFENEVPGRPRDELPDTAMLLLRGAELARERLADQPAAQVDILVAVGRVFDRTSRYDEAQRLLDQAVEVARTLPSTERARFAATLSMRGQLDLSRKRHRTALTYLDEALALQQAEAPQGLDLALTLHRRAQVYSETDRNEAAIADYQASIAIREAVLAPDDPLFVKSYGALGTALTRASQMQAALPWLERAVTLSRRVNGDTHEETARRLNNLSLVLMSQDRFIEADACLSEAVAIGERAYAKPNALLATLLYNLAFARFRLGKLAEAMVILDRADRVLVDTGQTDAPMQGFHLRLRALMYETLGKDEPARAAYRDTAALLQKKLGGAHRDVVRADIEALRFDQKRARPAADGAQRVDALQRRLDALQPPDERLQARLHYVRALVALHDGDAETAQRFFAAYLQPTQPRTEHRSDSVPAYADFAASQLRRHAPDEALRTLNAGLALVDELKLPPTHYLRGLLLLERAMVERSRQQPEAARRDAAGADAALRAELPAEHPLRKRCAALLAAID